MAIARALIHNRSILLVDEGTSALDQKNADIVEQSLLDNPNLTLILVSHHLTQSAIYKSLRTETDYSFPGKCQQTGSRKCFLSQFLLRQYFIKQLILFIGNALFSFKYPINCAILSF